MKHIGRTIAFILVIVVLGAFWYLSHSSVDLTLTEGDRKAALFFSNEELCFNMKRSFSDEIKLIKEIQHRVINHKVENEGIPHKASRDPLSYIQEKKGLCYDTSWVMEKVFRVCGFSTRHIYIMKLDSNKSKFSNLARFLKPRVPSHAVSEVLTTKGWMLVDSNHPVVAINGEMPLSIYELQEQMEKNSLWFNNNFGKYEEYDSSFFFIYGLYSRHGNFFPPYNRIPDVNYVELLTNIYSFPRQLL